MSESVRLRPMCRVHFLHCHWATSAEKRHFTARRNRFTTFCYEELMSLCCRDLLHDLLPDLPPVHRSRYYASSIPCTLASRVQAPQRGALQVLAPLCRRHHMRIWDSA